MNAYEQMREALEKLLDVLYNMGVDENTLAIAIKSPNCHMNSEHTLSVLKEARAALDLPRRNCDVGTPDEQSRRYCKFTDRYNPCSYRGNVRCAEDCPIHIKLRQEGHGELLCQLEWAQMQYTAEGDASR